MDLQKVMGIIEGILFISGNPINIDEISNTLDITNEQVLKCIEQLQHDYDKPCHGLMISKVGQRIRMTTKPEIFPYIETIFKPKIKAQLSKAALETLAIIMFKQPVTRAEIEEIRGVNSERALSTLQAKNLVYETGRLNVPGRPILYSITEQCMDYFGLESIEDIPIENKK
ncbi:MAG TPA: SMC-Scp complex subunit ScpB [Thermoanaerobacterales bacterium]|nr:SMC-Scp complex subunit ScpB [Thermoanaerobacterales bacterium]